MLTPPLPPYSFNMPLEPIEEYLKVLSKEQQSGKKNKSVLELSLPCYEEDLNFMLAIHQLLFHTDFELPFHHHGVCILEDRGNKYLQFGSPGGLWYGYHREFSVVPVESDGRPGAVATAALSVQRYTDKKESNYLFLCVGFRKESVNSLPLQLDMRLKEEKKVKFCKKYKDHWEIRHSGRLSGIDRSPDVGIKEAEVIEAVIDAGREDLIEDEDGKTWISLGKLPINRKNITWENSKETLANLIHYGLIRTEFKDEIKKENKIKKMNTTLSVP